MNLLTTYSQTHTIHAEACRAIKNREISLGSYSTKRNKVIKLIPLMVYRLGLCESDL